MTVFGGQGDDRLNLAIQAQAAYSPDGNTWYASGDNVTISLEQITAGHTEALTGNFVLQAGGKRYVIPANSDDAEIVSSHLAQQLA